jgi:cytochrome c
LPLQSAFLVTAFAADAGEALFNSSGCSSCHSVDKKVVGPALKDVAAKYAGDKNAQAMLEKKVRSGGPGSFPNMPMPPRRHQSAMQAANPW